jgi:hypothetical protein
VEEAGRLRRELGHQPKERNRFKNSTCQSRLRKKDGWVPRYLDGLHPKSMGWYWTNIVGILLKVRGNYVANRSVH